MTSFEELKANYLRSTRELLCDHSEELHIFEELWAADKLREAYLLATETARKLDLKRSAENDKADEDFYWAMR